MCLAQIIQVNFMTTLQLKKQLIHQISEIDDETLLDELINFINQKKKSKIVNLTSEQKEKIYQSLDEIEKGLCVSESELEHKFNTWLEGK